MEKIVQLKDTSNQNISPITVAEAVLKEDTSIVSSLLPEPEKPNSILVSNGNTSQWKPSNAIFQGQLELLAYGVRIDQSVADPKLERIGNMSLHRQLPIQSKMRRCLLLDDGTVNYYLDPNNSLLKEDGTPAVLDGTDGQVMVEIPRFYYLGIPNGSCTDVYITEYPLEGFYESRKQYVSAYLASLDRTNTSNPKLCSVVNTSPEFRGGTNNSSWDGTYRSLLGMPATGITTTNFRNYARNRGEYGLNNCGWNCYTYELQKIIYWLFIVEYANRNSQDSVNKELDSNGFKQGGLGIGCTTLHQSKWANYNSNNPFIPCGYTNSVGNNTGEISFTMPTEYDPENEAVVVTNSYRGLENIFGHLYTIIDGLLLRYDDGVLNIYICTDPKNFSDETLQSYTKIGPATTTSGTIKELFLGPNLCNLPSAVGNYNTSIYYCDTISNVWIDNNGKLKIYLVAEY